MLPRVTKPNRALDALLARGVDAAKDRRFRDLAEIVVELRQHFVTADGAADWGGRTRAYRDTVSRIYDDAGLEAKDRSTVRYHIGNVVRDVAPAEELADLGLQSRRPVERVKDQRDRLSALARAGALQEKRTLRRANVVRLLVSAEEALAAVTEPRLAEIDDALVEDAVASLENTAARADALRRALEPRRARRRGGIRRRPKLPD